MASTPPEQPLTLTLPDDIARLAAMYAFGSFYKAYRAEERRRAMLIGCPILILGPPLLCGGLVALLTFSYAISAQLGLKGDSNYPQLIAVIIACVVMIVFAAIAMNAAWTINASGTVVYLFQNGIIHTKRAQPTLLHWQQIVSGQLLNARRNSPTKLVIKAVDRRVITLHTINDLKELAERVQQALARRQIPQYRGPMR